MAVRWLPLQMRFLAGESTGSYVTRLAGRNGLTVGQLLDSIRDGLSPSEVDPSSAHWLRRQGRQGRQPVREGGHVLTPPIEPMLVMGLRAAKSRKPSGGSTFTAIPEALRPSDPTNDQSRPTERR